MVRGSGARYLLVKGPIEVIAAVFAWPEEREEQP